MKKRGIYLKTLCILFVIILAGCSAGTSTVINIRRDLYNPDINESIHNLYKGRKIFLHSIVDESKDTTNFYSYNPDHSIAFAFFYKRQEWQQPLASFYWYAYQKAFESMEMTIEEEKPSYDSPELAITFHSINSQKVCFHVLLISKSKPERTLKKEYCVTIPPPDRNDPAQLEKDAYKMINKTITAILSDVEFQTIFFNRL